MYALPMHIRHVLLYYFDRNKSLPKAKQKIQKTYGENSIDLHSAICWYRRFKAGIRELNDFVPLTFTPPKELLNDIFLLLDRFEIEKCQLVSKHFNASTVSPLYPLPLRLLHKATSLRKESMQGVFAVETEEETKILIDHTIAIIKNSIIGEINISRAEHFYSLMKTYVEQANEVLRVANLYLDDVNFNGTHIAYENLNEALDIKVHADHIQIDYKDHQSFFVSLPTLHLFFPISYSSEMILKFRMNSTDMNRANGLSHNHNSLQGLLSDGNKIVQFLYTAILPNHYLNFLEELQTLPIFCLHSESDGHDEKRQFLMVKGTWTLFLSIRKYGYWDCPNYDLYVKTHILNHATSNLRNEVYVRKHKLVKKLSEETKLDMDSIYRLVYFRKAFRYLRSLAPKNLKDQVYDALDDFWNMIDPFVYEDPDETMEEHQKVRAVTSEIVAKTIKESFEKVYEILKVDENCVQILESIRQNPYLLNVSRSNLKSGPS